MNYGYKRFRAAGDAAPNDVFERTVSTFNATPLMTVSVNGRRVSSAVSGTPGALLFYWQKNAGNVVFAVRTQAPYWVERVQRAFNITPVDGRYGPLTVQAITTRAAADRANVGSDEAVLAYALSKAFFNGEGIVGLPASRVMPNPSNPVRAPGNSSYLAAYNTATGAVAALGSDGLPIGAGTPAPSPGTPLPTPTPVPATPATNVVDTTPGVVQESRIGNGSPVPAPNTSGTGANNALNTPDGRAPTGVTLESRDPVTPQDRAVLSAGTGVPAAQGNGRVFIRVQGPAGVSFTAPTATPPTQIISTNVDGNALVVLGDTRPSFDGNMPFEFAFTVGGSVRRGSISIPVHAGEQTNVAATLSATGEVTLTGPVTFSPIGAPAPAPLSPPVQPPAGMSMFAKSMLVIGGLVVVAGGVAIASSKPSKAK